MKHWLFFLLIVFSSTALPAQIKPKQDSLYIEPRSFDNGALRELKNDKDFQYNKSGKPALSLWNRFWNWFWWKIAQVLSTRVGRITFWSVLALLAITVIVFYIMKLTGMDRNGLFGRGNKGLQKYSLSQNDINGISFDEAIEEAMNNGNYRLATRLQYLQALKRLSDKGYIDWRINKTNTDYLAETRDTPFNNTFSMLTLNFEYIWYGEKNVSKEQFLELRSRFHQFNNLVQ